MAEAGCRARETAQRGRHSEREHGRTSQVSENVGQARQFNLIRLSVNRRELSVLTARRTPVLDLRRIGCAVRSVPHLTLS